VTAGEVEARLQAPRSLWDETYIETSWITQDSTHGPIHLIPRLQAKIDQHYPGTKMSISEYNYGAGGDISGGLAQADVLGVFGREGLFAATVWLMSASNSFLYAGFAMYRNYDGNSATFVTPPFRRRPRTRTPARSTPAFPRRIQPTSWWSPSTS